MPRLAKSKPPHKFVLDALAPLAQNQCANGIRVDGTTTDPTAAVIPGAQVRATNGETATTDTAGHYVLPCVPATSTTLTAQADGFARGTASARARQGGTVHVNLQPAVAAVQSERVSREPKSHRTADRKRAHYNSEMWRVPDDLVHVSQ
jgi:hypothetical protein